MCKLRERADMREWVRVFNGTVGIVLVKMGS